MKKAGNLQLFSIFNLELLENESLAQLVEQVPFKHLVEGSSPSGLTLFFIYNAKKTLLFI